MLFIKRIRQIITTYLVRFKLVKDFSVSLNELNQKLMDYLPFSLNIRVPKGKGEISVRDIQLVKAADSPGIIKAILACEFKLSMLGEHFYNTNLMIEVFFVPTYLKQASVIRGDQVSVGEIKLTESNIALLDKSKKVMTRVMPSIVGSVASIIGSMANPNGENVTVDRYASLLFDKSGQKILELYRSDIERVISTSFKEGDIQFKLDEAVFEERLFATYGREVVVEEDNLFFRF
jgi:hypothetical protein